MTFEKVIRDSRLTKIELAELYGVSRQTIHGWAFVGPPRANSLLARQAESISAALCAAIKAGQLPFAAMERSARALRVSKMKVILSNLKPAPVRG